MPPSAGIAAPSSAHTKPSQMAISAPAIQPNIAWGPPMVAMMSGIVMNGPTPTIWDMFTETAPNIPRPRTSPFFSPGTASAVSVSCCTSVTR